MTAAAWRLPPELTKLVIATLPSCWGDYDDICSAMLVCKEWKVNFPYRVSDFFELNVLSFRLSQNQSS
jgi:hypothetical protein